MAICARATLNYTPSCTHIWILFGECNNIQWFQRTDLICINMNWNGTSIKYKLYLTWKRSAKNQIEDFIEKTASKNNNCTKVRKPATTCHVRQVVDVFQGFRLSCVFKINCIYTLYFEIIKNCPGLRVSVWTWGAGTCSQKQHFGYGMNFILIQFRKIEIQFNSQYQSLRRIQDFSGFFKLLNPLFFYRDVQMFLPNVLLWSESQNHIFSAIQLLCFLEGGSTSYLYIINLLIFIGLNIFIYFGGFSTILSTIIKKYQSS
jgi:hypothetical protein